MDPQVQYKLLWQRALELHPDDAEAARAKYNTMRDSASVSTLQGCSVVAGVLLLLLLPACGIAIGHCRPALMFTANSR